MTKTEILAKNIVRGMKTGCDFHDGCIFTCPYKKACALIDQQISDELTTIIPKNWKRKDRKQVLDFLIQVL